MTEIKKGFIILNVVVIILLLINPVYALTGSIGNARMILYPEVNGWTSTIIEKSILVKNVNDELVKITLEADEEGKEFLEVIDNEFTLEPGSEKKAKFVVKVRKEGNYEGRINVFFSPVLEEGPGVVLSSTVIVVAKKDQGYNEVLDEEDEENNEVEEPGVNIFTGGVTGVGEKNSGLMFLIGSSIFLLIVLVGLIYFMFRKNKSKSKKRKVRRKRK